MTYREIKMLNALKSALGRLEILSYDIGTSCPATERVRSAIRLVDPEWLKLHDIRNSPPLTTHEIIRLQQHKNIARSGQAEGK
jgi:hypothetical protein